MYPDQLASEKPADLDLHCFQNRIYLDSALQGLRKHGSIRYLLSTQQTRSDRVDAQSDLIFARCEDKLLVLLIS